MESADCLSLVFSRYRWQAWPFWFRRSYRPRMTSQHDKAKRWRRRFSVRTLVVLVTLVCCYAACWGPTKTRGVDEFGRNLTAAECAMNALPSSPSPLASPQCDIWATLPLVVAVEAYLPRGNARRRATTTSGSSATSPSCRINGKSSMSRKLPLNFRTIPFV